MNILFTTYSGLGIGGAETSMKLLAEGLRKLGDNVIIASSGEYENGRRFKSFRKIPFYSIHNRYLGNFFSKIVMKENIDIIHAHDRLTSVAAIRTGERLSVPVVVHFRDYWFACPRSSCLAPDFTEYDKCSYLTILKKFPAKRWLWEMYKWRYIKSIWKELNDADLKIANGSVIKRRLEGCGVKDAKVIPILRDFPVVRKNGNEIKTRYNLKEIVVTFIGSLNYHKGITNVLKFMPEILEEKNNVSLLVVGSGPLLNELKGKDYKDVVCTGRLNKEDVEKVYDASDIILLPSIWREPLSGILLEAASYNKVVVSSKTGGSPDILNDKYMVDPFDLNAWKNKIIELIEDKKLRIKMGREWGGKARKNYNVLAISKLIQQEYENVRHSRI